MSHVWKPGDLAKCIQSTLIPSPTTGETFIAGSHHIVMEVNKCSAEEYGCTCGRIFLRMVGYIEGCNSRLFVPVVPSKEEPKRRVKELEDA